MKEKKSVIFWSSCNQLRIIALVLCKFSYCYFNLVPPQAILGFPGAGCTLGWEPSTCPHSLIWSSEVGAALFRRELQQGTCKMSWISGLVHLEAGSTEGFSPAQLRTLPPPPPGLVEVQIFWLSAVFGQPYLALLGPYPGPLSYSLHSDQNWRIRGRIQVDGKANIKKGDVAQNCSRRWDQKKWKSVPSI